MGDIFAHFCVKPHGEPGLFARGHPCGMVGKASSEMRALDPGVVGVEGADSGGIGGYCSSTSNEGEHVCIANKSRDTVVACTRR